MRKVLLAILDGYGISERMEGNAVKLANTKTLDSIFKNYLRTCDELSMYITCDATNIDVRGYSADNKFANNMKPYLDFFGENGIFIDTNLKEEDAEKIIELLTVFEDKNIVKEELNILFFSF